MPDVSLVFDFGTPMSNLLQIAVVYVTSVIMGFGLELHVNYIRKK